MSSKPKNPVMADVAARAGVNSSTVSLALRHDPRISQATRERVEKAAAELGYRVHPMVAAWVATRRARRPGQHAVPLAYITSHPAGVPWGKEAHFSTILSGAAERVEDFGYRLNEYRLADYDGRMAALNRVLITRAVHGIIIGPTLLRYEIPGLDWERFSIVTIGYSLSSPVVHRVTEDHYFGMKLAFESCLARSHRRIGLAITGRHHVLRRERWIGAYLAEQHQLLRRAERLPILELSTEDACASKRAQDWVKRNRPEIVLADQPAFWEKIGVRALGFAITGTERSPGVHENNRGIGRHAADLLIGLLLRNERGVPASRQTVLVEPELGE